MLTLLKQQSTFIEDFQLCVLSPTVMDVQAVAGIKLLSLLARWPLYLSIEVVTTGLLIFSSLILQA